MLRARFPGLTMSDFYRSIRRLLPAKIRRRVAEKRALVEAQDHINPQLARGMLGKVDAEWRGRIDDVLRATDNEHIPRVPDAGTLSDGTIVMHNGLRVGALGYYGEGILNMLVENRGVHEPQEERAFGEVLRHVAPGGVILELGAYWGFYSMWFLKEVADGRAYLVEPDAKHLRSGMQNFEINGMTGHFQSAYVGMRRGTAKDGTPMTTLDDLAAELGIDRLAILHSDIQGAEADMLEGGRKTLESGKVDYVFISTHSNDLHRRCLDKLRDYGFGILVSCDLDSTSHVDGVIVAKRNDITLPERLDVEGNLVGSAAASHR